MQQTIYISLSCTGNLLLCSQLSDRLYGNSKYRIKRRKKKRKRQKRKNGNCYIFPCIIFCDFVNCFFSGWCFILLYKFLTVLKMFIRPTVKELQTKRGNEDPSTFRKIKQIWLQMHRLQRKMQITCIQSMYTKIHTGKHKRCILMDGIYTLVSSNDNIIIGGTNTQSKGSHKGGQNR
jgi:hypothetical protein